MDEEQYMKERVEDQIIWYGRKSAINKRLHMNFSSAIVISAAMIPFFSGIATQDHEWPQYVTGILGVVAASLTGIVAHAKFQEKWTIYRATAENLERERLFYNTGTGPYSAQKSNFGFFVENIEKIMGGENEQWSKILNTEGSQQ